MRKYNSTFLKLALTCILIAFIPALIFGTKTFKNFSNEKVAVSTKDSNTAGTLVVRTALVN